MTRPAGTGRSPGSSIAAGWRWPAGRGPRYFEHSGSLTRTQPTRCWKRSCSPISGGAAGPKQGSRREGPDLLLCPSGPALDLRSAGKLPRSRSQWSINGDGMSARARPQGRWMMSCTSCSFSEDVFVEGCHVVVCDRDYVPSRYSRQRGPRDRLRVPPHPDWLQDPPLVSMIDQDEVTPAVRAPTGPSGEKAPMAFPPRSPPAGPAPSGRQVLLRQASCLSPPFMVLA